MSFDRVQAVAILIGSALVSAGVGAFFPASVPWSGIVIGVIAAVPAIRLWERNE